MSRAKIRKAQTALAKALLSITEFDTAPVRTDWGAGMLIADVALSDDETISIYVHKDALAEALHEQER